MPYADSHLTCMVATVNVSVPIMPCDVDTGSFACGLGSSCNNTFTMSGGSAFVLRSSQIAALLSGTSLSNTTSSSNNYPAGALAGVGLGIGLPLLLALIVAIIMLRREKARHPKTGMYDIPDEPAMPLPALRHQPSFTSSLGRSGTLHSMQSESSIMPKSFMQKYNIKGDEGSHVDEVDLGVPRYELGSSPPYSERERVEAP